MDLEFTRGDTQFIKFPIKDGLGSAISPTTEDTVYFTVKRDEYSKKIILQKNTLKA